MYKSLQGGRAIAAILVVLFHLGLAIAHERYFGFKVFTVPFSFGSSGVEFFFVLSGFIIYTAHKNDIFQPKRFFGYFKKRFIRIYPTYWIVFLSVFSLAISFDTLRYTVPHDALQIIQSLLLIPQNSISTSGTSSPVLIVAWTLQYEMLFYIIFSFLILSKWLSIMVASTVICFYFYYSGSIAPPFPLSFLISDYIFLFAMGMTVSIICNSNRISLQKSTFFLLVGFSLFSTIALVDISNLIEIDKWRTISYGLAFSLIVFGLVQAEKNGKVIFKNRWIQLLGDSSYALYLIHYPLISIMCKLALIINLNKLGIIGSIISYFAIFGACLISSIIFHIWVEKPVVAHIQNRLTLKV